MSISTLSFNTATRSSLAKLQTQISDATLQMNNAGRLTDVGRSLGRLTGAAVSARTQETSFKAQQESNKLVTTRLENIDASLLAIRNGAESLGNSLIGISVATNFGTLTELAKSGLQQLAGSLNSTSDGQYLFGGSNTDEAPIAYDVNADTSLAAARFSAFAGATTGGTKSAVTASEMTAYLSDAGFLGTDGVTYRFADLFDQEWGSEWSNANSDTSIESRISKTETITSSASANDQAFRDIAAAYTAIADFDLGTLNDAARDVVTAYSRGKLTSAGQEVIVAQASIGTKLNRIEAAGTELQRQEDIMKNTVANLEEEDITEVTLRVTQLETQLEAAYTVTGRIQNLSLLNYI
ncbi:MAG: flagellar hook-associated family protein [Rhizobiaceae bacterium]|nr:flagellar hook-associated family protein [Rhizobiaceae bacterium]